MEITYHWEGDYLIPDLELSDDGKEIGCDGAVKIR